MDHYGNACFVVRMQRLVTASAFAVRGRGRHSYHRLSFLLISQISWTVFCILPLLAVCTASLDVEAAVSTPGIVNPAGETQSVMPEVGPERLATHHPFMRRLAELWRVISSGDDGPHFELDPNLNALLGDERIDASMVTGTPENRVLTLGSAGGRILAIESDSADPDTDRYHQWLPVHGAAVEVPVPVRPIQVLAPGMGMFRLIAGSGPSLYLLSRTDNDVARWQHVVPGPPFLQTLIMLKEDRILAGAPDGVWCIERGAGGDWFVPLHSPTGGPEVVGTAGATHPGRHVIPLRRVRAWEMLGERLILGTRTHGLYVLDPVPRDRCPTAEDFRPFPLQEGSALDVNALARQGKSLLVGLAGGTLLRVATQAATSSNGAPPTDNPASSRAAAGSMPYTATVLWRSPYADARQLIHRILVEPAREHIWLAVHDRLIHLNPDGALVETFEASSGFAPHHLSSLVIDPRRDQLRVGAMVLSLSEVHLHPSRNRLLLLIALPLILCAFWFLVRRRRTESDLLVPDLARAGRADDSSSAPSPDKS